LAAQLENSKTAELLIEKGASVNAFTTRNETPLHRAAQSESVNSLTTDNQTPLQFVEI
jgi:ankyrin repeat protein